MIGELSVEPPMQRGHPRCVRSGKAKLAAIGKILVAYNDLSRHGVLYPESPGMASP
ncbi:MAG TPA: hypothetical protein VF814_10950 [Casimicrobiaceae bacterium]